VESLYCIGLRLILGYILWVSRGAGGALFYVKNTIFSTLKVFADPEGKYHFAIFEAGYG